MAFSNPRAEATTSFDFRSLFLTMSASADVTAGVDANNGIDEAAGLGDRSAGCADPKACMGFCEASLECHM
jgi:hypothetical protein